MVSISKKEDVYRAICNASRLGTLGLFAGSGFTKAVLEGNLEYSAYTWAELLEKCCEKLNVDPSIMKSKGSYPEVASKICKQYAINNDGSNISDAVEKLKAAICELTTAYPEKSKLDKFSGYFEGMSFSWIATTNYDTIIESILSGRALPISPESCFMNINGMVPVYHIHGVRTIPNSIVITNEDYARLFRPNDYRQARLPFLMKESLVLMVGYALGDINVITAVDWSNNVYTNTSDEYDFPIIQLLYKHEPKDMPYEDDSGIVILEIDSLEEFFEELQAYYCGYQAEYDALAEKVRNYISDFTEMDEGYIKRFIRNTDNCREDTLNFISSLGREFSYIYVSYLGFLRAVIQELNRQAEPYGAFSAYDRKLNVILDIFEKVPLKKMPASIFAFMAESFDGVAYYVGTEMGKSWNAQETWEQRKETIPKDTIEELWNFIKSSQWNSYKSLRRLLKTI